MYAKTANKTKRARVNKQNQIDGKYVEQFNIMAFIEKQKKTKHFMWMSMNSISNDFSFAYCVLIEW